MPQAAGDEALTELVIDLYEAYYRPLFAYVYRLVGEAQWAQDVVQETFLRLYRERAKLAKVRNHRAWAYRVASHVAFTALRRGRRGTQLSWQQVEAHVQACPACARRLVAFQAVDRELEMLRRRDEGRLQSLRPDSSAFRAQVQAKEQPTGGLRRFFIALDRPLAVAGALAGLVLLVAIAGLFTTWFASLQQPGPGAPVETGRLRRSPHRHRSRAWKETKWSTCCPSSNCSRAGKWRPRPRPFSWAR